MFAGRQGELEQLRRTIALAADGAGQTVLVSGESGIGKSRLVMEALDGVNVLVATGRARERSTPPYAPLASALREILAGIDSVAVAELPQAAALGVVLPELGSSTADSDPSAIVAAVAAVLELQSNRRPLALILEDIHWADNATLELLAEIADRIRRSRVVLIGTYRSDEVSRNHPIRRLRSELRRARQLHEINLSQLSRQDVASIIEHELGAKPSVSLVNLIADRSQGVPLFAEELVRSMKARALLAAGSEGMMVISKHEVPVPESIRDSVLLRADALPPEAREMLEVVAVIGTEFPIELASRLAGSISGIEALVRAGFIVETAGNRGVFRHELIRDAVCAEIPWSKRRMLHREIAQFASETGEEPGRIAQHWLAAGEHDRARTALVAAADRACQVFAYRDAVQAAQQALELWPEGSDENRRLELLERLAHCAYVSGQLSVAVRTLTELIASPIVSGEQSRLGEAYRSLATIYGLQGAWEKSIESRLQSAEALKASGRVGDGAAELHAAGSRLVGTLQLSRAIEVLQMAESWAEKDKRFDVQAMAMGLRGNVLSMQGRFDEGKETARRALNLALKHNESNAASDVYRRLAASLEYAAEYPEAKKAYDEALDYCRSQGAETQAHVCLGCMSALLFWTGDYGRAIEVSREVIDGQSSPEGSIAVGEGTLGLIHAYRGELRLARQHLDRAMRVGVKLKIAAMELIVLWGYAVVETFDGHVEKAAGAYQQLLDRWQTTQDRHDSIPALCFAAAFYGENNQAEMLTRCAETLGFIASETGSPEALAALALALGESAMVQGNREEAVAQLEKSLSMFNKVEAPLMRVLAEFRFGVALASNGEVSRAVDHLQNAHSYTRRTGLRAFAAQIAEQLHCLGETVEDRRSAEADSRADRAGLTRRQLEITRLLADGLTNKEIADKLFLSVRTVDMHVANVLTRLDCRKRAEAARKAADLGLLD